MKRRSKVLSGDEIFNDQLVDVGSVYDKFSFNFRENSSKQK
jgi:hypothetical protein